MGVRCRALRAVAVAGILVAGCGGQPGAAPAQGPVTASPAAPVYRARASAIPAWMRRRMTGVSWRPGCPLGPGALRLLRLSYWGLDHVVHQGQLIVNASAAKPLARAFGLLFAAGYPIQQMRVVDAFGGSDERSMLADNTLAFNCRRIPGTTSWSEHAYGLAVDINPLENPEVAGAAGDPPAAGAWASRSRHSRVMIRHGNAVWRAFISIGWQWGGDWISPRTTSTSPPTAGDGSSRPAAAPRVSLRSRTNHTM
jgi:D-alanyl-D-alanine carboxypeptidase